MLTNILHGIFYIMPIFFIWSEVYHIRNRNRLYIKLDQRYDLTPIRVSKVDYIFYMTKLLYLLWIMIGLFSSISNLFLLILLVSAIKFLILLFKSKKFSDIYDTISSIICIIILGDIFMNGLKWIISLISTPQ